MYTFSDLKDKYTPSLILEEELEELKLGQAVLLCKGLVSELIKKAITPEEKKSLINTILHLQGNQKKHFEELCNKFAMEAEEKLYCLDRSCNGLKECIAEEIITSSDIFSAKTGINQPLLRVLNSEKIREDLKEKKLSFNELYKISQEWYVKGGCISIEKAQNLDQKQLENLEKDGIRETFDLIRGIISFSDFIEILKEPIPEHALNALDQPSTRRYLNGIMQATEDKQGKTAEDLRTLLSLEPDFFKQAEAKLKKLHEEAKAIVEPINNALSPKLMELYKKTTPWFSSSLRSKPAAEMRELLFFESEFFSEVSPKFRELLSEGPAFFKKLEDKLLPNLKEFLFSDEESFRQLEFRADEKDLEARLYQGYLAASDIPEAANLPIERLRGLAKHQRQNLNFIDIANKCPKLKNYFLENPGAIEKILEFPTLAFILYPDLTDCDMNSYHQQVGEVANKMAEILEKDLLTLPQVLEIFSLQKTSPHIISLVFHNIVSTAPLKYEKILLLLKKDDNDIGELLKRIEAAPQLIADMDEKSFKEFINKDLPSSQTSEWGPLIKLDAKNVKRGFIDIFSSHVLPLITSYNNPQEIQSLVLEDAQDLINPHYNAYISDDKNYWIIPGAGREIVYGKIGNLLFSFYGGGKGSMRLTCFLIEKDKGKTILFAPYILEFGRYSGVGPRDFFPWGLISHDSCPTDVPSINSLSGKVNKYIASLLKAVFDDALHSNIKNIEDFHRRIIAAENSKPPIKKLAEYLRAITTQQMEELIEQNPAIMFRLERGLATCIPKEVESMETVFLKILESSPKFLVTIAIILGQESTEYTYKYCLKLEE